MKRIDRIGETNINRQGLCMEIIDYNDVHDIKVKFSDGYIFDKATYRNFLSGAILSPLYPQYLGVGYIGVGEYKSRINNKKTTAYIKWASMLTRCYSKKYFRPITYEDCYVCDEWLNFQNFAEWHYKNYYEIENDCLELDKDIICKGNKVYCPEMCLYVPHKLNTILCNRKRYRGKYPIGVTKHSGDTGYNVSCNVDNKQKYIGTYYTPEAAFQKYKEVKENEIRKAIEIYKGKVPEIVINSLLNYEIEITD